MKTRTKADPDARYKADMVNVLSSLQIVLQKVHDMQTKYGKEVSPGIPDPKSFMVNAVEKYVKLSIAILKKAMLR